MLKQLPSPLAERTCPHISIVIDPYPITYWIEQIEQGCIRAKRSLNLLSDLDYCINTLYQRRI
jgi:hypothetical protein